MFQSHVKDFDDSAKSAGALGARRSRLSAELLRYGMDAFKFVENEYYTWVSGCLVVLSLQSYRNCVVPCPHSSIDERVPPESSV